MGIHESKFSSSSSSASSSFKSSVFSSRDQRRRSRRNYTLITSSSNNNNNNRNVGVSVAAEATNGGENKEELAVCLASISLMALTGEDAHLPKPGCSSSSSSFSPPVTSSSSATIDRSSFRNPFGRKKSSASWSRSSSTSAAPAAPVSSSSVESVSAAPSIKTVKTKLCERLKRHKQQQQQQQLPHHRSDQRHQLMEDDRFLAEHFNAHIQLLDCLEHEQEDDSSDWATMRSWLVWCLQNKLGDIESTSNTEASEEEEEDEEERDLSVASSSFRITSNPCSSTSRRKPRGGVGHHHQLRRQLALDERSRSVSSSRVLRRQETSFDGAAVCSPQSSFESYGSTGTGGGT